MTGAGLRRSAVEMVFTAQPCHTGSLDSTSKMSSQGTFGVVTHTYFGVVRGAPGLGGGAAVLGRVIDYAQLMPPTESERHHKIGIRSIVHEFIALGG